MKKINKFLMAIAAALVLIPAAQAQVTNPEIYEFNETKGIGTIKYLLSSTPNEDGEYMLHIENFITGKVKATTTPTDFVLVLDVSGSMLYDYRTTTTAPAFIRKTDNDNQTIPIKKLRLDDGHDRGYTSYTYNGMDVNGKAVGTNGGSIQSWLNWAVEANTINDTQTVPTSTRYYYYEPDATFYRLNKWYEKIGSTYYRYIYFDRVDASGNKTGERRYVVQGSDNNITTSDSRPSIFTNAGLVMLKDNAGSNGYQLYRFGSRKDALKDGVHALLEMLVEENKKDDIWGSDVSRRHQVAIVAFSANNNPADAELDNGYSGGMNDNTKVAKPFGQISESNIASYSNWDATCKWLGGTYIDRGLATARRLFVRLVQQHPDLKPLNSAGGTNRNKVVIVLTDGEPSGGRNTMGGACTESVTIKTTGSTAINGLVYSINLAPNLDYAPAFLQHVSSNYPDGRVTNANSSSGAADAAYSGTGDDDGPYYVDATKMEEGLVDVFKSIAAANTGALSSNMVAVDIVSDNFYLPFTNVDLEKVTMYTAECIGKKTFTVDGVEKEYLAFAEPIKVRERPALAHLWVIRNDVPAGGGVPVPTWHDLPAEAGFRLDIDDDIQCRVSDDGKAIIVSGFDYADLWCGEDPYHENDRQMASTDPNADYALPGYRGFKMIFEFPIKIDPDALGGVSVPTNDPASGLYQADSQDNPTTLEEPYPEPNLPVPVKLIIQKAGLKPGESANFTIQRKLISDPNAEYQDVMTFVLTGGASTPEIRIPNLDPAYYYKIKEGNWSWAYSSVSPEYSTENTALKNPILFDNTPIPNKPDHAEAKATNKMQTWSASSTSTVNSK